MNQQIEFPDRRQIEWWLNHLKSADPLLKLKLPHIDEKWYDDVCNIVMRLQFPFMTKDLHALAAHLFYNIDKRHDVIDGNKRSSIVMVYLFYLVNGHLLLKSAKVKELAKKLASSRGHKRKDAWIAKISKKLEQNVVRIEDYANKQEEFEKFDI